MRDVDAGTAVSRFQSEQTEGEVRLRQEPGYQGVNVTGQIRGLLTGQYVLLLVNLSPEGCENVKNVSEIAELNSWDQGTGDVLELDKQIQGVMPRQEERAGLLIRNCTILPTGPDCRRGDILECAEISWPRQPRLSWHIWLILCGVVFLLVLLLLCIPLICYCAKRYPVVFLTQLIFSRAYLHFRSRRKHSDNDLDDEYEDRSKSPMYDELSLPFIDASLPPTPKVGRIVNGLDILLGHSVSENSLVGKLGSVMKTIFHVKVEIFSDKKSQVQW